jgi:hypothetical protein
MSGPLLVILKSRANQFRISSAGYDTLSQPQEVLSD